MILAKKSNQKLWNIISAKLADFPIFSTRVSEKHSEQLAGGIQITPRNLSFLIKDMNKNLFNDKSEVKKTKRNSNGLNLHLIFTILIHL